MNNISVCGLDCAKCSYASMCKGCNACKGVVFHTDGKECAIYHCCVTEHGFSNCLDCTEIPCAVWQKTRDPSLSDEQFEVGIKERIELLKNYRGVK